MMEKNLNTELFRCISSVNSDNVTYDDKKELLSILTHTNNPLIWNHIALLFSDLNYNEAVPFIIKKIMKKKPYNDNGTLVFALENLDCRKYFIPMIKIICEMEYETRLGAYEIVESLATNISSRTKKSALRILEARKKELINSKNTEKGRNSTLHFVEKTAELIR